MTKPCILLLRASLNVEFAWRAGWTCSSQLGTSANLIFVSSPTLSPPPHLSPLLWHTALHQWSQLGMILHFPRHRNRSGWRAAVWFPVSGSGSNADPCKSCSSDRSSLPKLQVHQIHGVHHGRPPAATMTLDRFVGPLSADMFPTTLACDRGSQGLSAGGSWTGPPCKSTAKDHPDHVPSQRELEGTPRLRTSTWGQRLAESPLRPRSCRNLTEQRG